MLEVLKKVTRIVADNWQVLILSCIMIAGSSYLDLNNYALAALQVYIISLTAVWIGSSKVSSFKFDLAILTKSIQMMFLLLVVYFLVWVIEYTLVNVFECMGIFVNIVSFFELKGEDGYMFSSYLLNMVVKSILFTVFSKMLFMCAFRSSLKVNLRPNNYLSLAFNVGLLFLVNCILFVLIVISFNYSSLLLINLSMGMSDLVFIVLPISVGGAWFEFTTLNQSRA